MTWLCTVRQREEIRIPHIFQPEPRKEGRGRSPPAQPTPTPRSPRSMSRDLLTNCTTTARGFQVSISQDNKSTVQQEFSSGSLRHKSQSGEQQLPRHLQGAEGPKPHFHGAWGSGSQPAPLHNQIPTCPKHLLLRTLRTTAFDFMVAIQGRYSYSQLPPLYAPSRLFFTTLWITASIFFSVSSSCK